MAAMRSVVWPATRLGKWAAGAASASVAGLWVGTVVPERAGGLALGLVGGVMALTAAWARGDLAIAVLAAFIPFAAAVYLVRRSLATIPAD
jgi:hypothetical protein